MVVRITVEMISRCTAQVQLMQSLFPVRNALHDYHVSPRSHGVSHNSPPDISLHKCASSPHTNTRASPRGNGLSLLFASCPFRFMILHLVVICAVFLLGRTVELSLAR